MDFGVKPVLDSSCFLELVKFMFFVVGGPTLFVVSGFTLALFAILIVHLVRVMKMWLVVISAT